MKNILKLAAALLVISTSAPVFAASGSSQGTGKVSWSDLSLVREQVGTARFTPPQFCWIGKVKVACDFTDVPPRDPGK